MAIGVKLNKKAPVKVKKKMPKALLDETEETVKKALKKAANNPRADRYTWEETANEVIPLLPPAKRQAIADFVKSMNQGLKKSKGMGRIDIGAHIQFIDPGRILMGILGFDLLSNGGVPRGMPTQLWGPFSSGKTTTAIHMIKAVQRIGGTVCWAAAESFDKRWARKNGVLVPYSDEELHHMRKRGLEERADRIEEEQDDWPTFVVMQHAHGDGLLEMVCQGLTSNMFDLMVVDSLGQVRNYKDLEEHSLEDDKYGGEAKLFSSFTKKVQSAFNKRFDPKTGAISQDDNALPNQTALVCINQAREKIGGYNPRPGTPIYKPVGGEALKHLWHLSLEFSKGQKLKTERNKETKEPPKVYGQTIQAFCDKSKIGPPFREAEWDLYFQNHEGFIAGEVDVGMEVLDHGVQFGVIDRSGSNYFINGEKINGRDNAIDFLRNNDEERDVAYKEILKVAREAA